MLAKPTAAANGLLGVGALERPRSNTSTIARLSAARAAIQRQRYRPPIRPGTSARSATPRARIARSLNMPRSLLILLGARRAAAPIAPLPHPTSVADLLATSTTTGSSSQKASTARWALRTRAGHRRDSRSSRQSRLPDVPQPVASKRYDSARATSRRQSRGWECCRVRADSAPDSRNRELKLRGIQPEVQPVVVLWADFAQTSILSSRVAWIAGRLLAITLQARPATLSADEINAAALKMRPARPPRRIRAGRFQQACPERCPEVSNSDRPEPALTRISRPYVRKSPGIRDLLIRRSWVRVPPAALINSCKCADVQTSDVGDLGQALEAREPGRSGVGSLERGSGSSARCCRRTTISARGTITEQGCSVLASKSARDRAVGAPATLRPFVAIASRLIASLA